MRLVCREEESDEWHTWPEATVPCSLPSQGCLHHIPIYDEFDLWTYEVKHERTKAGHDDKAAS